MTVTLDSSLSSKVQQARFKRESLCTQTLFSVSHKTNQTPHNRSGWKSILQQESSLSTTNTSLIVVGEWEKREVEAMDNQTLQWSTVATLPHPLSEATATVCGGRLYLAGGFSTVAVATKSVLECKVKDLLKSQPIPLVSRIGLYRRPQVWREVAPLPVKHSFSGHLPRPPAGSKMINCSS